MAIFRRPVARGFVFMLASNAAVLFVMQFGLLLWPERLPVNTQNVFWLASGVNTAGLLLLGLRWWPILLLNAFPPWLCGFEALDMCLIGATTNALEALLAAWIILRFGKFEGSFDSLRSVIALVVASLVAPCVNTLVVPAYMCWVHAYPWADYGKALEQWNLSNGASMLGVTALIVSLFRSDWTRDIRVAERLTVTGMAVGLCLVAFWAVFHGTGMNYVFVIFPLVIYTAVRFGIGETTLILGIVLISIFASLALYAGILPLQNAPRTIWFIQAFFWVLAATGLLMAALAVEHRRAEIAKVAATLETERARLAALRYQIHPHFLFNALNSLRSALPLSEPVAREMVTDLSSYLRSTLERAESDFVILREEVHNVRNYLAIEQHRVGERLQIVFALDPVAEEKKVPIFLLQPLVENAVRHGLENSWKPCCITISAHLENSSLQIEIANTGQWQHPGKREGLGLENIRRRLRLLYDSQASLRICHGEGMVRIQIQIPI